MALMRCVSQIQCPFNFSAIALRIAQATCMFSQLGTHKFEVLILIFKLTRGGGRGLLKNVTPKQGVC